MSEWFLLSKKQFTRITPYVPLPHGVPRVDDLRVVSGIIDVVKNGLPWKDAPRAYGPPKTLYNRFIRWSRMGVFDRIFRALAGAHGPPDRLMIAATHLKAHRTAASLLKKGLFPAVSAHARRPELEASCGLRWRRPARRPAPDGRTSERLHGRKKPAPPSAQSEGADRRPRL